jgi:Lon protease-like protein
MAARDVPVVRRRACVPVRVGTCKPTDAVWCTAWQTLPVITSRNRVLLPGSSVRLKIGRPATLRLVEECIAPHMGQGSGGKGGQVLVAVVALEGERAAADDADPTPADLHPMGCVGRVFRCERVTEDNDVRYNLVIEGALRPLDPTLWRPCLTVPYRYGAQAWAASSPTSTCRKHRTSRRGACGSPSQVRGS